LSDVDKGLFLIIHKYIASTLKLCDFLRKGNVIAT
jgi:hypothetical protein